MLCSMQTGHKYTHSGTRVDMGQLKPFHEITQPKTYNSSLPRGTVQADVHTGRVLGGGGWHVGGPAHLIGSLQGPLAVLQDSAEGDVGVLLHELLYCHFIDLQPKKSCVRYKDHQNHPLPGLPGLLTKAPRTLPHSSSALRGGALWGGSLSVCPPWFPKYYICPWSFFKKTYDQEITWVF